MKSLAQWANERRGLNKVISTYKVPSKTTKGVEYTVNIDMYGNTHCDCVAGEMNRLCSHKKIIKYKFK